MFSQSPKITIQLTQGAINHNYLYLRSQDQRDFFPKDSIGGRNKKDKGKTFSVYLEGLNKQIEVDIPENKRYLRVRGCWGQFFAHHKLKAGDKIIIEKLSDYKYKSYPQLLTHHNVTHNDLMNESQEIDRILAQFHSEGYFDSENIEDARRRIEASIAARKGQDGFRSGLLTAYQGQCAITGFNAEQALEAAHIRPYQGEDTSETWNGLLLRADIHTLFDLYLITVHPHTKEVIIAPELKSTDYSQIEGKKLRLPKNNNLYLKTLAVLKWHYNQCEWV